MNSQTKQRRETFEVTVLRGKEQQTSPLLLLQSKWVFDSEGEWSREQTSHHEDDVCQQKTGMIQNVFLIVSA